MVSRIVPDDSRIMEALRDIASSLCDSAQQTVLFENPYKHVFEIKLIVSSSWPSGSVVDLGGGPGINFLALRKLGHLGRLMLVDRFEEYDDANRMGHWQDAVSAMTENGIDVVTQDFWSRPAIGVADSTFDAATCFDVVEHLPGHPLRQLRELKRLLKPAALCAISGPNAVSLMKRIHVLLGRYPYADFAEWTQDRYFEHYREYTRSEYEQLLRMSGFEHVTSYAATHVTQARARHGFWRGERQNVSVRAALWAIAGVERLNANVRHTVYAWGKTPRERGA